MLNKALELRIRPLVEQGLDQSQIVKRLGCNFNDVALTRLNMPVPGMHGTGGDQEYTFWAWGADGQKTKVIRGSRRIRGEAAGS